MALALGGAAACGKDEPSNVTTAPDAPFEPTAFTVDVHGSGRPVILIPGLGCGSAVWTDTVAHLAGYQTHVLQLAGFAGLPRIDAPLLATVRAQLAQYIVDRKLDHPIIIGHSLGGFLAYGLASTAPELVGPIVIVDSGASLGTGDPATDAATGANLRAMWADADDAQFKQQATYAFSMMVTDGAKLSLILDDISRSDRTAIGDAIAEMFTTDLRPGLGQIRVPVLAVLADGALQDSYRATAEVVPDHQVIVVPHARHFVFVDQPAAFDQAIDTFFAAHPAVKAMLSKPALSTVAMTAAALPG